jgi:lysophospholipase L1-like esterase
MISDRTILWVASAVLAVTCPAWAEFVIRDGDTVVFLGDSITAARGYGKVIENYTLLRYPERKVRFVNAGWGGDTAAGGAARLERDVFRHGATLLTVAYGINDIGWGARADDAHKRKYLDGIRDIVFRCKERGIRVFICSAAITGADPATSEDGYFQKMCDEGMAVARSLGAGRIDVQRSMRDIQKRVWKARAESKDEKDKPTLHAADGIHLNDLGQLAMAFAILKGLGAPAEVSAATIDAAGPKVDNAVGCNVSGLQSTADGLEFDRLDNGLPLNFGPLGALNFRFIPIPEELNHYMLTVRNLRPGSYQLTVSGRPVGTWTHEQWATGVNISSATPDGWEPGGPWDAQAATLLMLTESRNELAQARKLAPLYVGNNPNSPTVDQQAAEINTRIQDLQRLTARPVRYHFVLKLQPPATRP